MANVASLFPVKLAENINTEVAGYVTSAVDMPLSGASVLKKGWMSRVCLVYSKW